jgi:hypothetical protein
MSLGLRKKVFSMADLQVPGQPVVIGHANFFLSKHVQG